MRLPMPPIPMKPTVSFIAAPSSPRIEQVSRCPRLSPGARIRLAEPVRVLGRAVEPVGRLEPLEPAFGGRLVCPGEQVGYLLLRQRPERLDRLEVLLEDLQAVDAGDDGRGRQGHRIVEALDGTCRLA